jgi:hypothetical protein
MGHSLKQTNMEIQGSFYLSDGNEAPGTVLVSDSNGNVSWASASKYNPPSSKHYIGELFGGGVVVSIWRENDIEKCLVAGLENISYYKSESNGLYTMRYGLSFSNTSITQNDTDAHFGASNSNSIVSLSTSSAAKMCIDYLNPNMGLGVWDDWFLPSIGELSYLVNNAAIFNKVLDSWASDNEFLKEDVVKTIQEYGYPGPIYTPLGASYSNINLFDYSTTRYTREYYIEYIQGPPNYESFYGLNSTSFVYSDDLSYQHSSTISNKIPISTLNWTTSYMGAAYESTSQIWLDENDGYPPGWYTIYNYGPETALAQGIYGWTISNNNLSIRFNVADSAGCGGTTPQANSIQYGTASVTITVGTSDTYMGLTFSGMGETMYSDFEYIQFKITGPGYTSGTFLAEAHAPGGHEGQEGQGYECIMGPVVTSYSLPGPYTLQAGQTYTLDIYFTTNDHLYHNDAYYEVGLTFSTPGGMSYAYTLGTYSNKSILAPTSIGSSILAKVRPFRIADDTQKSIFFEADFIVISYQFSGENDLDTKTSMITPNRIDSVSGWDTLNNGSGWTPQPSPYNGQTYPNSSTYSILWHGGDNTGMGFETVLININAFKFHYPNEPEIVIDARGHWYTSNFTNPIWTNTLSVLGITQQQRLDNTPPVVLGVDLYKGGEPIKDGNTWINPTAGASFSVGSYGKNINVAATGNIDGVSYTVTNPNRIGMRVARLTYNILGKYGRITID